MHLLIRAGTLSVGVNTSFVLADHLAAFPANPVGPTSGDNANGHADERWDRSEEVTHEHSVPTCQQLQAVGRDRCHRL